MLVIELVVLDLVVDLFLQSTLNGKLVNCFFHDNLGNGLTVHNTIITLAGKSEFNVHVSY